jgi:hypothetical protein
MSDLNGLNPRFAIIDEEVPLLSQRMEELSRRMAQESGIQFFQMPARLNPVDRIGLELRNLNINELNELSQEIRKARKRLKYDDRVKELGK